MHPDAPHIEYNLACFDAAVATTIGSYDPACRPLVQHHGTAVTVVSDAVVPASQVGGILNEQYVPAVLADYPVDRAPLALELAPIFHPAPVQIALHAAGLTPVATDVVWLCDLSRLRIPRAPANLVWGGEWHATNTLPQDHERILRSAYQRQPGAMLVSVLHPDGIIASAGVRCDARIAYFFGGWVAPHRRIKGVVQTLLDARIRYAAEHECHTIVLVAAPQHGLVRSAVERGFLHGWGRERWTIQPTHRGRNT